MAELEELSRRFSIRLRICQSDGGLLAITKIQIPSTKPNVIGSSITSRSSVLSCVRSFTFFSGKAAAPRRRQRSNGDEWISPEPGLQSQSLGILAQKRGQKRGQADEPLPSCPMSCRS